MPLIVLNLSQICGHHEAVSRIVECFTMTTKGAVTMTNHFNDENGEEKEQSFAALLEAYSPGADADIGVGDKIRGKIVSIGKESVFVDTGTKIDGVVDKAELLDENRELTLTEGDMLELYIVALSDEEIKLSKALSGIGGLNMLAEA